MVLTAPPNRAQLINPVSFMKNLVLVNKTTGNRLIMVMPAWWRRDNCHGFGLGRGKYARRRRSLAMTPSYMLFLGHRR